MTNQEFIDNLYNVILDAINESYNYLPTNLQHISLSDVEIGEQAYFDALGSYVSGGAS